MYTTRVLGALPHASTARDGFVQEGPELETILVDKIADNDVLDLTEVHLQYYGVQSVDMVVACLSRMLCVSVCILAVELIVYSNTKIVFYL